jgi:4a-hydroxytetrahydrobiopterin dehydratase
MAITKLSDSEIQQRLTPGWTVREGKLHRELQFADFTRAFGFMASCALVAERLGHHPEWFNVYNKVVIDLTTHDAGGISAMDFELAAAIDGFAKS